MKKLISLFVLLVVLASIFVPSAKSNIKPYYSGDAIGFNGQVFIGTANMGVLELFALEDSGIVKKSVVRSDEDQYRDFTDMVFVNEKGRLYVYAINGRFL